MLTRLVKGVRFVSADREVEGPPKGAKRFLEHPDVFYFAYVRLTPEL